MAHIFKKPENGNKGIIIFTHKEMAYLNYELEGKSFRKIIKFVLKIFKHNFNIIKIIKLLNSLKKQYFIGIHWGGFSRNIKTPNWVDFHMSIDGTATFIDNPMILKLSSSNFTPNIMKNTFSVKYWDIITVARINNVKKLDVLLYEIKKIYNLGYKYKVLFVIPSNLNELDSECYTNIFNDYNTLFTPEERELFTIIKTDPNMGNKGFSYTFLSYLYNQSKVFTLFTQAEGESRVIKEALLCGLTVVVKNDLDGGGRNALNDNNSVLFNEYDNAHNSLIEAVEKYKTLEVNQKLKDEFLEENSINKLHEFFDRFYSENDMIYDKILINTDQLNLRLPAHLYDIKTIPWAQDNEFRFKTTDIVSIKMLKEFIKHLKEN